MRIVEPARRGLPPSELGGDSGIWGDLRPEKIDRYVLLPGDPARVSVMARLWEKPEELDLRRGFRYGKGLFKGASVSAVSTGIGGASLEVILNQAAELGADTFIRVGTTGSLHAEIQCGDLIINEGSVRLDGTSRLYVREEYPAVASYEVTLALVEACERLGVRYHVGIGATTASFLAGQGRMAFGGYTTSLAATVIPDMRAAGVLNFEQEGATLLTLARLFGLRAGVICSVMANRMSGEWDDRGGVERACRVASEAVGLLAAWDRRKDQLGKRCFCPGLIEPLAMP